MPNELHRELTAKDISAMTLEALREARVDMNSAWWLLELEDETKQTKTESALLKMSVHHAIIKLENIKLKDISEKLKENEAELIQGRENLEKALQDLENVKNVIGSLTSFLGTVGKFIPLLV
jgi:hypothetical protein